MGAALRHRGPDDEGYLIVGPQGVVEESGGGDTPPSARASADRGPLRRLDDSRVFPPGALCLGHRRLSILDLTPNGHQPMSYGGRHWITYNGEIYNFVELREELEALGCEFRTRSDTEVILAAYEKWGADCLRKFNGMWAFALYDATRRRLFLSRDRFGVKPLYFYAAPGVLAFSSEIKGFAVLDSWRAAGNMDAVLDYLVWGVTDVGGDTMFRGVRQLLPGHLAWIDVDDAARRLGRGESFVPVAERWYSPRPAPAPDGGSASEAFRGLLADSVRLRLRSDVAVGSCLSGGLDSSSIVCLLRGLLDETGSSGPRQLTVTASSAHADFDETRYARAVAQTADVDGVFVTPDPRELFDDLDGIVRSQDEPFASTSIFAQWCVFRAAKAAGVKVMLDGQGADEILCGYRGFFGAYLAELLGRREWGEFGRELMGMRRTSGFSVPRLLGYAAAYSHPSLARFLGGFDRRAYGDHGWLVPEHRGAFARDPISAAGGRSGGVLGLSLAQIQATNLPMLLRWEDRNSMAFSVEARTPFLDYRLVEAVLGFPSAAKIRRGVSKAVLRDSMRGLVPDAVLDRKDKMGFVTAESAWVRGSHAGLFRDRLSSVVRANPGLFSPRLVSDLDAVSRGAKAFDHRYWRAINFGVWAEVFGVRL